MRWRVSPRSSSAQHNPAMPATTAGSSAPARRIVRAYPRSTTLSFRFFVF
jgi:hypothetical protein